MNPQLQRVEIEMPFLRDHKFAVEYAFGRKLFSKRIKHLGEVAVERFLIAALDEDFVGVAKDDDPETIPLRLIDPIVGCGDLVDTLGEHGKDGRTDSKFHAEWADAATQVWMRWARCSVVWASYRESTLRA